MEDRHLLSGASLLFDFDTSKSPVATGYTHVPLAAYSSSTGFGWEAISKQNRLSAASRRDADPLTRDLHLGKDAVFLVDLPNGTYDVIVCLGDKAARRDQVAVWAEGNQLASGLATKAREFLQSTHRVGVTDGQLTLRLADEGGKNGKFAIYALEVHQVSAATANAGADQSGGEGQSVSFQGSALGAAPLTYSWDFGDGGSATGTLTPTHTYADNGQYTVTLQVTDGSGDIITDTATVTASNVAPTAVLSNDGPVSRGNPVVVSFSNAIDPSNSDVVAGFTYSYDWTNDGTFDVVDSTSSSRSFSYLSAGTRTVRGRITDKDGGFTDLTTTVTVTPGAPGDFIVTPWDTIPNFGKNPTIVSATNGDWSDPATWSPGRVPQPGDVVSIATSTTVTYDLVSDTRLKTIVVQPGGRLLFRTDGSTKVVVQNFLVLEGGELQVGTAANPVEADVKAEIVFPNVALDTTADPSQYGNGLIVLGKVSMHGAVKNATFVRLAVEPRQGDTTLTLSEPVAGWKAGDKLVIPDSKHFPSQSGDAYVPEWEVVTLSSVSADGLVLTLTAGLQFDHPGARNGDDVLEYLPHVGNLTRNVLIRSESSTGVRGHAFFTYRADVDIRFSQFAGLGRTRLDDIDNTTYDSEGNPTQIGTNQSGRYSAHFHHLMGPTATPANGHQYTFSGNAVLCMMPDNPYKWGITLHDSHYGLIKDNVLYNWAGAGVVTEDGSESFNVIEHNMAVRGIGEGDRAGSGRPGDEGMSFWFRGPNNYVRDNVAANYRGNSVEAAYGYKFFMVYLGDVRVPNFKGADTSVSGEYTVRNGNAMPLLEFDGNEAYGVENGLTIWWLNAVDTDPQDGGNSVVKDFVGWHIDMYGFYGYPMNDVTFDGYTIRGDKSLLSNRHEFVMGMWFGDYMTHNLTIRRADIQGVRTGIIDPYFGGGDTIIEDSYLRNSTNIAVRTIGAPGSGPNGAWRDPKSLVIRSVRFGSTDGWNLGGVGSDNIAMWYDLHNGSANLILRDTVLVYDYNGVAGDDFQVFYNEQRADFIVPKSSGNLVGSPVAGLTNQQNWNQHQIAIAGAVAPSSATSRPEIDGLVLDI